MDTLVLFILVRECVEWCTMRDCSTMVQNTAFLMALIWGPNKHICIYDYMS